MLLHLVCYMMMVAVHKQIFQGRGGFLGHFNKHLIFDKRKKDRAGKNILYVLKLFLFLTEFQLQCSYEIVLIKKS